MEGREECAGDWGKKETDSKKTVWGQGGEAIPALNGHLMCCGVAVSLFFSHPYLSLAALFISMSL